MHGRVTIFGGSGFIGRHLVWRLLESGTPVCIVARHIRRELFAGRPDLPEWLAGSLTDQEVRERAVEGTAAIVNLVGTTAARGADEFFELHCEAPRRLAEAAHRAGVGRFVQISAMGVAPDAPALADRSKAAGEQAIRETFPDADIVRPALVYGVGDHFLSRFLKMVRHAPAIPLIGGGCTRFQPIHVEDAAETIARILETANAGGQCYGLGADEIFSFRALIERLCDALDRRPWLVSLPFPVARLAAGLARILPEPPLTLDQVRLLQTDKLMEPTDLGPQTVGVAPRSLEAFLASAEAHALLAAEDRSETS
jgi:uncharacterized protein YbjT (DUF2867 family)